MNVSKAKHLTPGDLIAEGFVEQWPEPYGDGQCLVVVVEATGHPAALILDAEDTRQVYGKK